MLITIRKYFLADYAYYLCQLAEAEAEVYNTAIL